MSGCVLPFNASAPVFYEAARWRGTEGEWNVLGNPLIVFFFRSHFHAGTTLITELRRLSFFFFPTVIWSWHPSYVFQGNMLQFCPGDSCCSSWRGRSGMYEINTHCVHRTTPVGCLSLRWKTLTDTNKVNIIDATLCVSNRGCASPPYKMLWYGVSMSRVSLHWPSLNITLTINNQTIVYHWQQT